jgi:hypothetical protein
MRNTNVRLSMAGGEAAISQELVGVRVEIWMAFQ